MKPIGVKAYYKSEDRSFTLLLGDCIELMSHFDFKFDMILPILPISSPMME